MHHAPSHAPLRHLGIREAARQLGLAHTTISRYIAANPVLNHGTAGRPKVDLDELRRHRAANLNPAPRGRQAAKLLAEAPAATGADAAPDYSVSKAAREAILADRARIDLDEKRGLLVPRAEVEAAAFEVGKALQRDLLELAGRLSEILTTMTDPKAIAALVESEHRNLLRAFAASLRAKAAAEEEPRAAGQVTPLPESTPARLCPRAPNTAPPA